jgi:hypothetical protein
LEAIVSKKEKENKRFKIQKVKKLAKYPTADGR